MNPILLIAIIIAGVLAIIVAIAIARASQFPVSIEEPEGISLPAIDGEQVAKHLGLAIQHKTISDPDPTKTDPQPFIGLRQLLYTLYPAVFDHLQEELINEHAILLTWQGSNPSLDPIAFTSHQDVVPANEGPDSTWTYPPFSGTLADGYVWGRGALDTKCTIIGILEAVNNLLREGFEPDRTVYIAFGHDEEVSGTYGAKAIAETLEARGIHLAFLLDEGGVISTGFLPGINTPVGLIGVAEKGHVTLKLRAEVQGGHSAYPPEDTAIGALSLAISTLEANPFPQTLDMLEFMMSFVGNELPFGQRLALANPWLFGKAIKRKASSNRHLNAITRTTLSPTIIKAGSAENVLPSVAEAIVNIRIMPGETLSSTYEYVRDLVADDVVSVLPAYGDKLIGEHSWDPVDVSDIDSPHFLMLYQLIRAAFPGAQATPILIPGATDARHYQRICNRTFRFSPMMLSPEESNRTHGVDECLSFENAGKMVAFFQVLIQNTSSLTAEAEIEENFAREPQTENLEQKAIRDMNEALPTRPIRQRPPAAAVFEPADLDRAVDEAPVIKTHMEENLAEVKNYPAEENPITDEELEAHFDRVVKTKLDDLDDDFDFDAPLKVRPMKKD